MAELKISVIEDSVDASVEDGLLRVTITNGRDGCFETTYMSKVEVLEFIELLKTEVAKIKE